MNLMVTLVTSNKVSIWFGYDSNTGGNDDEKEMVMLLLIILKVAIIMMMIKKLTLTRVA